MAALVEGLAGRLGEAEPSLHDALAQIRLAFVQISESSQAEPTADPAAGREPIRRGPVRADPTAASADVPSDVIARASSRPTVPGGHREHHPACPTSMRPGAVGDRRAVEGVARAVVVAHDAEAPRLVELGDHPDPRRPGPPRACVIVVARPSVDDLGDRQLDDVGGALVLQRRDQDVDVGLGHHRLHRVARVPRELRHRRATSATGRTDDHRVELVRRPR